LTDFDSSNNFISDLIELEMCCSIKKLNLNNNLIEAEENLTFICGLENLEYIDINNNPIVKKYEYCKNYLKNNLPNVKIAEEN
jgi:Leucine-rich repeat (LRR) protein